MAKKVTKNTTVYSAAAWWRENDPSMGAVALTAERAKKEIFSQMKDAAKDAYHEGSYKRLRDAQDAIAWSGVSPFALKDLASDRELEEAIDDLEDNGVWYPPGR